jgi:nucleoid-associated protein YgaU
LAAVVAVSVGARALGLVRVAAVAERVLPRSLRRLAAGLAGTGLVLAVASPPGHAAAAPVVAEVPSADPSPMTMRALTADALAPDPQPRAAASADVWVVEPGESFWVIAESVVGEAIGRAPSDREVEPYWHTLIEANRGRLVSDNPDLITPGQELALPPVP